MLWNIKWRLTFALAKIRSFILNIDCKSRRGAGVAERGSLLRSCTFTGTGGSNPFLSAIFNRTYFVQGFSEFSKQALQYTNSGCSVARSSRLVWDEEVAGSNPATPTSIMKVF